MSEFILLEPSEDNFHFYSGWFLNIINFLSTTTSLPHPRPPQASGMPKHSDSASHQPPIRSPYPMGHGIGTWLPLTVAPSSYPQQRPLSPAHTRHHPSCLLPVGCPCPHPAGPYPSCSRQKPPLAPAHNRPTRQPPPAPPPAPARSREGQGRGQGSRGHGRREGRHPLKTMPW